MRNVLDKIAERIQTLMSYSISFLWDNAEKYCGAKRATNDVTIGRVWVACWMSKATCTHTPGHTHAGARALTPHICNIYCLSTRTTIRECAPVLGCTRIFCLIMYLTHHRELLYIKYTFNLIFRSRKIISIFNLFLKILNWNTSVRSASDRNMQCLKEQ